MSARRSQEDEFIVIASDGLWEVLSSEDAVRVASAELTAYEDAQVSKQVSRYK